MPPNDIYKMKLSSPLKQFSLLGMASSVPMEALLAFHSMEREIFSRLVLNLVRDPFRSMQMIALWLWIERMGFPNIIQKMLELPDRVLNAIADEAEACLRCLQLDIPPPISQDDIIPITRSLTEQPMFSLEFLHERRREAVLAIKTITDDICSRIFKDIMEKVAERVRETALGDGPAGLSSGPRVKASPTMALTDVGQMMSPRGWIRPHQEESCRQGATPGVADMTSMIMMGPRIPQIFRPNMCPLDSSHLLAVAVEVPRLQFDPFLLEGEPQEWSIDIINDIMAGTHLNPRAKPWAPDDETSQGDRTMFLTFSRGYPLSEEEIREFFFKHWGDCIQSLFIQETAEGVQPLFARLVLYSPAIVPMILQGQEKAKFVIKGKHVWVRPYVPKKNKPQSPV